MAQCGTPLSRGTDVLNQARRADKEGNEQAAFDLFMQAIDFLQIAKKYEKNRTMRGVVSKNIEEALSRAEELKAVIGGNSHDTPTTEGSAQQQARRPLASSTKKSKGAKGAPPGNEEQREDAARESALDGAIKKVKSDVTLADVAGLAGVKYILEQAVLFPMKHQNLFAGDRKPWTGVLLYGPPGTGKSYLAKALANEANSTFFMVSSSDIVSKWLGESEKLIRTLFEMAHASKPSVVFVDEIDSLLSARSETESESSKRIKTEFLVRMNGADTDNRGVLVLGATNRPWALDPAVRRRFEQRVYIPLPDAEAREAMLRMGLTKSNHTLSASDYSELAIALDGYSGSDISIVVRDALMEPVREAQAATHFVQMDGTDPPQFRPCRVDFPGAVASTWRDIADGALTDVPVARAHFDAAIRNNKPSVGLADICEHENFTADFGKAGQ